MGWNSGGELFDRIAELIVNENLSDKNLRVIFTGMIEAFEDHDCDVLAESKGIHPILDEILDELYKK